MIAIVGSDGSMGQRYQACLKHLGEKFVCLDKNRHNFGHILTVCRNVDSVIIATPTNTHVEWLNDLLPLKKKILCEKPITKNIVELEDLINKCHANGYSFDMVFQYKELAHSSSQGLSHYDYFRHGSDGLAWDCIQIIGLANGEVSLKDESPIWKCSINDQALSLADMDRAYVSMLARWIAGERILSLKEILDIHYKVLKFIMRDENESN